MAHATRPTAEGRHALVPLAQDVADLVSLAVLAGDAAAADRWRRTSRDLADHRVNDVAALQALLAQPPDGFPPAASALLAALSPQGAWIWREQAIADLPAALRTLFETGGFPLTTLSLFADRDVVTYGDLAAAVARQGPAVGTPAAGVSAAGRDTSLAAPMAAAWTALRGHRPGVPIGRALDAAAPFLTQLAGSAGVRLATTVGSLRRGHDTPGDVDLLVVADHPEQIIEELSAAAEQPLLRRPRRLLARHGTTEVSVRATDPRQGAASLVYLTGSAGHVQRLEALAAERQLTLTPAGLHTSDGRRLDSASEDDIYHALGLPFIAPELRHGGDEFVRARERRLPDLVTNADILGDLHMHTRWSDGRDTVDDMVRAAHALGYRYLAITDHSPRSSAARNLTLEDIDRQADEIAAVRERYPAMTILHGCEVDILRDGALDFPEKTLRRFDIVLASLHDAASHSPQQLLRRYLAAMLNANVTVITHPANRLFPHRGGYDLDFDRLFEAAIETRTLLEIDGAPSHVDMDAGLASRALAAGVQVVISSDAHAAAALGRNMEIGLLTARRAGAEPRQVANTRPWPLLRAMIAAKRGRSLR